MKVHSGFGGWHRATGEDLGLPGRVYFRVQEVDGILRMTELYVDGRGAPLLPSGLRRFPVQLLERTAARLLGLGAPGRESRPGPDLSRLAAFFDRDQKFIGDSWVRESFLAQLDSGYQIAYPRERKAVDEPESEPLTLEAPADGRLSDAFLSDVSRAYQRAVESRQPPAKTLAALAGVSNRTVHRWVYTARKRGIMPPASSRGRIV